MAQEKRDIPPTGGQKQYELAIYVLVLYPILILGGALAILHALPHGHQSRPPQVVVTPTDHEPFHWAPSVLPPLQPEQGR